MWLQLGDTTSTPIERGSWDCLQIQSYPKYLRIVRLETAITGSTSSYRNVRYIPDFDNMLTAAAIVCEARRATASWGANPASAKRARIEVTVSIESC